MMIEKCLTCPRPAKDHCYLDSGVVICDDEGHPILDKRKSPEGPIFFRSTDAGFYPLFTKWTRRRMSHEHFVRQCCLPHVIVTVRLEVGFYGGKR